MSDLCPWTQLQLCKGLPFVSSDVPEKCLLEFSDQNSWNLKGSLQGYDFILQGELSSTLILIERTEIHSKIIYRTRRMNAHFKSIARTGHSLVIQLRNSNYSRTFSLEALNYWH